MILNTHYENILSDALSGLAEQVQKSQLAKGLLASGKSAKSLRVITLSGNGSTSGQILGVGYWQFQQNGRGPGKFPKPSKLFVEIIRQWLAVKGLNYSPYAVAFKINRDGIKVPNKYNPGGVLSEPLSRENVINAIAPRVRAKAIEDIRAYMFS